MSVKKTNAILKKLIERYPALEVTEKDIISAFEILTVCFKSGQKLLVCGNGGSAADSEHIVGELMKSFTQERILPDKLKEQLIAVSAETGSYLAQHLQLALPAISLTCHTSLSTAFANDVDPQLVFAQQVVGYGNAGDVLWGISTSGNSENIVNALITAKGKGLKTIGLTGQTGGKINTFCDALICVQSSNTAEIQELHLPVYHALCDMLETEFFCS